MRNIYLLKWGVYMNQADYKLTEGIYQDLINIGRTDLSEMIDDHFISGEVIEYEYYLFSEILEKVQDCPEIRDKVWTIMTS